MIVIATALSVPSCSKPSRYGLARAKHAARLVRRPILTASARIDQRCAGRDEETDFEIKSRNRRRKKMRGPGKFLDKESAIQGGPYHELGAWEEKCIRWVGPRYPPCLFSPARFATMALSRPIALEPSDQSSELSGSCGARNRGLHLRVNLRKGSRSICRGLEARAKTKEFARLT